MRNRDRKSNEGLLPRMEAREWKGKPGTYTYRFHPIVGKPVPLGTDRDTALRRVLDLHRAAADDSTCMHLWRLYKNSKRWLELADLTREDHETSAKPLLKVFGDMQAADVRQTHIRRYLMIEREGKVRGNHELALLSNWFKTGIDHGIVESNPCVGVERIKTRPRKAVPIKTELAAFLNWLRGRGKQWIVIAAMAEFAARNGSRRVEFLKATVFQVKGAEARLQRGKQRDGGEIIDVIKLSAEMQSVLAGIRREGCTTLFPTRTGNPYTDSGFKSMWNRAMKQARKDGIVTQHFTFHDLRAHYTSVHKEQTGSLPELHKDPSTAARVYDRRTSSARQGL